MSKAAIFSRVTHCLLGLAVARMSCADFDQDLEPVPAGSQRNTHALATAFIWHFRTITMGSMVDGVSSQQIRKCRADFLRAKDQISAPNTVKEWVNKFALDMHSITSGCTSPDMLEEKLKQSLRCLRLWDPTIGRYIEPMRDYEATMLGAVQHWCEYYRLATEATNLRRQMLRTARESVDSAGLQPELSVPLSKAGKSKKVLHLVMDDDNSSWTQVDAGLMRAFMLWATSDSEDREFGKVVMHSNAYVPCLDTSIQVDKLQGDDNAMQRMADRLRELSQENYFDDDIFAALLQNMVMTLCDKSLPANAVLSGGVGMVKPMHTAKDLQSATMEEQEHFRVWRHAERNPEQLYNDLLECYASSPHFKCSTVDRPVPVAKCSREVTEDHLQFAIRVRSSWGRTCLKEYLRKNDDAMPEEDVLAMCLEKAKTMNAGVAKVYITWNSLYEYTRMKLRKERMSEDVTLTPEIHSYDTFITGPGGTGKTYAALREAVEWVVNVPDATEPNDRNSQAKINSALCVCNATSQGALEQGMSIIGHRNDRVQFLGSKVSSKHTENEYSSSVSLDKWLSLPLSNPGKCVTINDEAFLTSAIYSDFGCLAHELALLESSLTSDLHAPQNLLRNLHVGDGDQISAFNGKWLGTDPASTLAKDLQAEAQKEFKLEEASLYRSMGMQHDASTSRRVQETKMHRFSDDYMWFLAPQYQSCVHFDGTFIQRYDEHLYDNYLDRVYPNKSELTFKHKGKHIHTLNVLDAMNIKDMPEEDRKLLRPFFFTADTQVLLGQMERRGTPDSPPNCSGSGTHHQIQGTGKTALVVATQTHFTITQKKPPRGQWWTSKVRQDLSCHPSSAYMRMQVRKGTSSIMINWVVGDSKKLDVYHEHMKKYTSVRHHEVLNARTLPDKLRVILGKPARDPRGLTPAQKMPRGATSSADLVAAQLFSDRSSSGVWATEVLKQLRDTEVTKTTSVIGVAMANAVQLLICEDTEWLPRKMAQAITSSSDYILVRSQIEVEANAFSGGDIASRLRLATMEKPGRELPTPVQAGLMTSAIAVLFNRREILDIDVWLDLHVGRTKLVWRAGGPTEV